MATPLYVLGTMTPFEANHFPFLKNCSLFKVKAHYGGQRMLSQILFFKIMQLSTFNFHQANIKRGFHKLY